MVLIVVMVCVLTLLIVINVLVQYIPLYLRPFEDCYILTKRVGGFMFCLAYNLVLLCAYVGVCT